MDDGVLWRAWRAPGGPATLGALAVALASVGLVAVAVRQPPAVPSAAGAALGWHAGAATAPEPVGAPLQVRIPSIRVSAPMVALGLDRDGALEVPPYNRAGWWKGGTAPGGQGPAVIAAHLDSTDGPAVFHRLDDLAPGALVFVDYRNTTVAFEVRRSASFDKAEFPTEAVYGPTGRPELRLITCDGSFDRRSGTYRANLVVWATLAGSG